jgi:hypothetical protein
MPAAADYLTMLIEGLGASPSPQEVVDALVPEVADLVLMFVTVDDRLRLIAFSHIDPEHHALLAQLAAIHRPSIDDPADPVAHVMRTQEARLFTYVTRQQLERTTPDLRVHAVFDAVQPRNIVVAPLLRDNACCGALVVAVSSSARRFIEGDLEFVRHLGARVGPIIRFA